MLVKIFISYSSCDLGVATNISSDLEQHGKKCWIAPRDIPPGMEYGEEIIRGIESSDAFILILSEASNASPHVLREVERAVSKKLPLFVIKIQDCTLSKSLEYFLLTNQWIDVTQGINGKLMPLIERLNQIASYEDVPKKNADIETEINIITDVKTDNELKDMPDESKKSPFIGIFIGLIGFVIIVLLCVMLFIIVKNPASLGETSLETKGELDEEMVFETPEWEEGEYVSFGRYYPEGYQESNNDGEIKWQIIESNEKENTVTMISAQIIDIKPFDCAESGDYGKDCNGIDIYSDEYQSSITDKQLCECFGSNNWVTSDLRAWLNATGPVSYHSASQADDATDEHGNGFESQLGFLSSFRKDEIALLNDIRIDDVTSDRVSLLSVEEVAYYSEEDFFLIHITPTKSACESDDTSWYNAFESNGSKDYLWVTRTPWDVKACCIVAVGSSTQDKFVSYNSACSGFGIRPIIKIDLRNVDKFQIEGEGSNVLPYKISFVQGK